LKECAATNTVVLVGDADLLADDFCLNQQGPFVEVMNGNLGFAGNAVEQLAGGEDLIAIRSRAVEDRPFTVIRRMEAMAQQQFQSKINELENSLQDTEQRLSALQQTKNQNQRFILSPEQQAELDNFRKKEAQVKSDLKTLQKDLRRDVVSLQTRIEWLNIAAMPVLVSAFGLGLAAWKRKRTMAR